MLILYHGKPCAPNALPKCGRRYELGPVDQALHAELNPPPPNGAFNSWQRRVNSAEDPVFWGLNRYNAVNYYHGDRKLTQKEK
jgi:hypothetical protein